MTNLSPLNGRNSNTEFLYVVQRCWHSGPKQYQPLDFLRLFVSQRDAEEAAYHSAHAWSKHVHDGRDVPIKTLLLPSYPVNNPQSSSYGFLASGTLFWVRAVTATMITARHHNRIEETLNRCTNLCYAIVTEGVIGGTGNKNSRRGTEVCEGRVWGGDALAHRYAMETMQHVQAGFQSQRSVRNVELKVLPVGKPDQYEYFSSGTFLQDWPPQVLQAPDEAMVDLHSLHNKRQYEVEDFWETQEEEGMVVDCPFEMPSAKRRRFDGGSAAVVPPTALVTPNSSISGGSEHSRSSHNDSGICNMMFQGTATGGMMVMRGGVFVGSTNGYNANPGATNHGGFSNNSINEDVAMT